MITTIIICATIIIIVALCLIFVYCYLKLNAVGDIHDELVKCYNTIHNISRVIDYETRDVLFTKAEAFNSIKAIITRFEDE